MAFVIMSPEQGSTFVSILAEEKPFATIAHIVDPKPFNLVKRVTEIENDINTPYITIPTQSYAKLIAQVEYYGGFPLDMIGDDPYWPSMTLEPDIDTPVVEKPAAKAMQLIAWGNNGLNATDKQCYNLVLHMTKTQPGTDNDYVRVSLGAITTRLGMSRNPASKSFWGLAEIGLIDAVYRTDPISGHKIIYARAGKMPVWGEVYAENKQRASDAKRKRVCEACGGGKLKIETRCICKECGTVQSEAPHYEELVDHLADIENSSESSEPCSKSDNSITSNRSTSNPSTSREDLCSHDESADDWGGGAMRGIRTCDSPTIKDCKQRLGGGWYYMASARGHERPEGAFLDGKILATSPERLAMWDASTAALGNSQQQ